MKAFLLAAGYGKRLRPLTDNVPKPLLRVGGKPLIQYHIENLARMGVTELVVNAHWLADKLIEFLGDGSAFGVRIQWSVEKQLLETGGGIKAALSLLGDDTFILLNGDVYIEYPLRDLVKRQLKSNLAHLILVKNPEHNPGGDFCLSETHISDATSATQVIRAEVQNKLTYAGIALVNPRLIADWHADRAAFPLLSPLLSAVERGLVSGEIYEGLWEDVGTPERLSSLNHLLEQDAAD